MWEAFLRLLTVEAGKDADLQEALVQKKTSLASSRARFQPAEGVFGAAS